MTGEKITMGEGKDAPLEHTDRKGHGGARRVASRDPEPDGGPGAPRQVSAILSNPETVQLTETLNRLSDGAALRRKDLTILRTAGWAAIAAREWQAHLADEMGRIHFELEGVMGSLRSLRAGVLGTDPETLTAEDLNVEDESEESDATSD